MNLSRDIGIEDPEALASVSFLPASPLPLTAAFENSEKPRMTSPSPDQLLHFSNEEPLSLEKLGGFLKLHIYFSHS